jgi:hypothetical protein
MSRAMLFIAVILAGGCKNIDGPCAAWRKPKVDHDGAPIEEQQRRARDKYAIYEDDFRTGPAMDFGRASPTGR